MIIKCPYCGQKIDTLGKEVPLLENREIIGLGCPKCKLKFGLSKKGVHRLKSELRKHRYDDNSAVVESQNY
ncbi:MAG: hypothetical protein KAI57_03945 [Candidatus Pacebacteria bacterium]|nr:hypothetical protein [Candidatus Paceibacterota bacterium]